MNTTLREIILRNNNIGKYLTDKAGGEFAVEKYGYYEKCHEYADLYDFLFSSIRDDSFNLLEIGIAKGGSILAWKDYFRNANIYGIDYFPFLPRNNLEFNDPRIKTFYEDAYCESIISKLKDKKFKIIIDDGPHTLESQKKFIELYISLVESNGFIIVEDVDSIESAKQLHKMMLPFTSFSMIVDRNVVSNYGNNEINVVGIVK